MRMPRRFSTLAQGVRQFLGYESDEVPRSQRDRLLDIRRRVTEAETHFGARNEDFIYWRNYILGDMQRDKYADQLKAMDDLAKEFVVTNYTRALVSHLISLLVSSLGEAYVVADDEARQPAGNRLTDYLRAVRHRDNYSREMRQWVEDAAVCGTGWLRAYYDTRRDDVCLRHQDALTVYPEPNAVKPEQCEFIGVRHVYNLGYARHLWEKLDVQDAEESATPMGATEGRGVQQLVKQIVIWEVYHDFGDSLTIYSGDQILHTGPAPVQGMGYPLFPFTFVPSNDEIRGYSLLRDIEDLQDLLNRVTTRMAIWQRYWANPMVSTDDPTGEIDNEPGGVWRVKRGMKADPVHPPPFPGELFALQSQICTSLDTITGIQEVNRGVRPEGVTAGVALDLLRQASEQRLTSPLEDINSVLRDAFAMVLRLMQNYYVQGRSVPLVRSGAPEQARIESDDLYSLGEGQNPETGEMEPQITPREYTILMQPPGDLPRSPAAKAELALQLFQVGAIDKVALLEAVKFEGREGVLQREAQMMQAMMQGQAAGMAEGQQEAAAAQAAQLQMVQ